MAEQAVDMKIRGIRQLDSGMRRLLENIDTAVPRDALRPTAEQVAMTVRSRVPVVSGRLRASVQAVDQGHRAQVRMGAGLQYARWIEYGGGRGRPFKKNGRWVLPTARRTKRALAKHVQLVTSQQIRRMHWMPPH